VKIRNENSEVDFQAAISLFWNQKFKIITITAIVTVIVNLFVYFGLEKKYTVQVLLSERASHSSLDFGSELGNLGALVGINMVDSSSEADKALAIMKTRKFIQEYVDKYNYTPYLTAVEKWVRTSNEVIFSERYSKDRGWLDTEPDIFEIKKSLLSRVKIAQDNVSNFYSISMTHESPYIAKEMLENLVNELNKLMQQKAIASSELNVQYLQRELSNVNNLDFRQTLLKLVEAELQQVMIARVHQDFVFIIEDPAVLKMQHSYPNYFLMLIISIFIGFGFGCCCVLLRDKL